MAYLVRASHPYMHIVTVFSAETGLPLYAPMRYGRGISLRKKDFRRLATIVRTTQGTFRM